MTAQTLVAAFFALLSVIFAALWVLGMLQRRRSTAPAGLVHLRIAAIFALVSLWLFFWPW